MLSIDHEKIVARVLDYSAQLQGLWQEVFVTVCHRLLKISSDTAGPNDVW